MTTEEVIAEGYESFAVYTKALAAINHLDYEDTKGCHGNVFMVWAVEFELA
jgi:hypothetical protein